MAADTSIGTCSWNNVSDWNPPVGCDEINAVWGAWHKKFCFVIFSDVVGSASGRQEARGAQSTFEVQRSSSDGQKFDWHCETADGKTGKGMLDGQSYELAHGMIFLVSTKGEKRQVRQLQRNLADTTAGPDSLEKLLKEDQEIVRFFTVSKRALPE